MKTEFLTARWVSGATTSTNFTITGGEEARYTIHRSTNDPGIDKDIQWAMHLEQSRLQANAIRAQDDANSNAFLLGILDGMNKASSASAGSPSGDMTCRPPLAKGLPIRCTRD